MHLVRVRARARVRTRARARARVRVRARARARARVRVRARVRARARARARARVRARAQAIVRTAELHDEACEQWPHYGPARHRDVGQRGERVGHVAHRVATCCGTLDHEVGGGCDGEPHAHAEAGDRAGVQCERVLRHLVRVRVRARARVRVIP